MLDLQIAPSSKVCRCVVTGPDGRTRYAHPVCLYCRGKGLRDTARKKTILRNQTRRIPTTEECAAFTGAHCKIKFDSISAYWRCPGGYPPGFRPRFVPELMCEQCNNADATAKRTLSLPKDFSFSPAEIATFVTAMPHGWHLLDYDIAAQIHARVLTGVSPPPARLFWPSPIN